MAAGTRYFDRAKCCFTSYDHCYGLFGCRLDSVHCAHHLFKSDSGKHKRVVQDPDGMQKKNVGRADKISAILVSPNAL